MRLPVYVALVLAFSFGCMYAQDMHVTYEPKTHHFLDDQGHDIFDETNPSMVIKKRVISILKQSWPLVVGVALGLIAGSAIVAHRESKVTGYQERGGLEHEEIQEIPDNERRIILKEGAKSLAFEKSTTKVVNQPLGGALYQHLQVNVITAPDAYEQFLKSIYFPGDENKPVDPTKALKALMEKGVFPASLFKQGELPAGHQKLTELDAMGVLALARSYYEFKVGLSQKEHDDVVRISQKIKDLLASSQASPASNLKKSELDAIVDHFFYSTPARFIDFLLRGAHGDLDGFTRLFDFSMMVLYGFRRTGLWMLNSKMSHSGLLKKLVYGFIDIAIDGIRKLDKADRKRYYRLMLKVFDRNLAWLQKYFPEKYEAIDKDEVTKTRYRLEKDV